MNTPHTVKLKDKLCQATKTIEDECCVMSFQCELPHQHVGKHKTTHPGQWGDNPTTVFWEDGDKSTTNLSPDE